MREVVSNLYVGDEQDCVGVSDDWAVVHAAKHPCHQTAVGYSGNLSQDHPEYLVASRGDEVFLNLVDMDRKLDHGYTEPIVSAALDFIGDYIESTPVLVHCNKGESRSPALALLYLSKRSDVITDSSYREAKGEFLGLYPSFRPGRGVDAYLRDFWHQLD